MKLSEKFFEDLHEIGQDAFIEKNMWVGKLVPEIIVDNLKKRGITPDDLEGVVCLSIEEADELYEWLHRSCRPPEEVIDNLLAKIKEAEKTDAKE